MPKKHVTRAGQHVRATSRTHVKSENEESAGCFLRSNAGHHGTPTEGGRQGLGGRQGVGSWRRWRW